MSSTEKSKRTTFLCQYYSDGSYVCYPEYATRTGDADSLNNLDPERVDPSFGVVGLGKPMNGTWNSVDGKVQNHDTCALANSSYSQEEIFWSCISRVNSTVQHSH